MNMGSVADAATGDGSWGLLRRGDFAGRKGAALLEEMAFGPCCRVWSCGHLCSLLRPLLRRCGKRGRVSVGGLAFREVRSPGESKR